MKAKYATNGATLIIVVLFTLLLLAVVLAATMRLGLASRQNTGDQKAILQAQYAAESNLALMRSQIGDLQTLLSKNSIVVPAGTPQSTAVQWGLSFCGPGATWVATEEFKKPRDDQDKTLYPEAKQCSYSKSSDGNQFLVLGTVIPDAAYGILPTSTISEKNQRPASGVDARTAWWKNKLDTVIRAGEGNYKIMPLRAVMLDDITFRYYVKVSQLTAQGVDAGANRVLNGAATQSGIWWFQLELPNLLKNVLMTNHHRSDDPGTTYKPAGAPTLYFTGDQVFDGPVFTNEKFLFDTSSKANFFDSVSSAGCIDLPKVGEPTNTNKDCTHQAGVYTSTSASGLTSSGSTWNKDNTLSLSDIENANKTLKNKVNSHTSNKVNFNGIEDSPNFVAQYKALPTNNEDQKKMGMSANGGITLPSTASGVQIFAGDTNGNALSSYGDKKWNEPNPTYQYISAMKNDAVDDTMRYRIDQDGNVYQYNPATKSWPTASLGIKFSGMVYSEGTTPIKVYGPQRLNNDPSGDLKNVPPALASFSNMTITSVKGMKIQTDLVMSDTPCANSAVIDGSCKKENVKNVLGLFSPVGDIEIDTTAPKNINIHSAMLTSSGSIEVTNYSDSKVGPRGTASIIGSVLENFYGPFFTFSGTKVSSGYQRDFHWDPRFIQGITPRGFPVSPTWNSSDGSASKLNMNNLVWKQGTK